MSRFYSRLSLFMAFGLLVLSLVGPSANGSSPTYLTTAITQTGMKQATIGGYNGVIVNYTNSYSTSFSTFVYLDLLNSAGQTVSWNVGYCIFSAHQLVQCFVGISSALPAGTYTAWTFAATNSSVPVSVSTSVAVTI